MNNITIKLMGGLGNYLFQIAAGYAFSLKNNYSFRINNIEESYVAHKPPSLYINSILPSKLFGNDNISYVTYDEPSFNYNEIPNINRNLKLNGYFQSEKYFINYRNEIHDLFLNEKIIDDLKLKYKNILNANTCSLHVRRGDYLRLQDYHTVLSLSYYKSAIDIIGNDKTFLIFSDDIDWCKEVFDYLPNKIFVEGNADYEDLYLMSLCNDNIIANSSFSWWGAWLNLNPNKIVISPKKWFGKLNIQHKTDDLYCENWIKI